MGYTAVRRGDPAIESFQGRFFKMRRALGATGVGLNEVRFEAGQSGPAHDEAEYAEEEVYVALEGAGTVTVDGEAVPFAAGTYVRVDPASTRQVAAGPDGLRFLVVGGRQGSHEGRPQL